jgi:hypothetical protein
MKQYQIVLVLVVALIPLGLFGYKKLQIEETPTVIGVVYESKGQGDVQDFHVTVYGSMPDACYEAHKPKVKYIEGRGENAATIQVEPLITKSRFGGGDCQGSTSYLQEGVLLKVPSGSYKMVVIGRPRLLAGDVALPRKGKLPEHFVAPTEAAPKAP